MALEVWNSSSRVGVLNTNWPLDTDPLNNGDDHIRLLKTVVKNLLADLLDGTVVVESATNATNATNAANATNSAQLGGVAAANYAQTTGTYASLRAQATTKDDVGLGNVGNYGISDSITSTSSTTYASANAARLASISANGVPTTAGAVKSYSFARHKSSGASAGSTVSGGSLIKASVGAHELNAKGSLSGTWRVMGYGIDTTLAGLVVRIS